MRKGNVKIIILGTILIILSILSASALYYFKAKNRKEVVEEVIEEKDSVPKKEIILFFLDKLGSELVLEKREIPDNLELLEEVKTVLKELFKGSESGYLSPFDDSYGVLQIFYDIDNNGLFINFNESFKKIYEKRALAQNTAVLTLIRTVKRNFSRVRTIRLLVNNEEIKRKIGPFDLFYNINLSDVSDE